MSWDVAVAGGGLAGTSAAMRLAIAGRRVVLLERERGPHDKVCGEFLSEEAAAELGALGLPPHAIGAVPIAAVRVAAGRALATADLPFAAWGLSRRRLDERLLAAATEAGVAVQRGAAVRDLTADGQGVRLAAEGGSWHAAAALLATGKHDLRGWRRPGASELIGLKLHLGLAEPQRRALAGHVELAMFAGGYAGLQLVEDDLANLCLVVTRARFAVLGRNWRDLVAAVPHLAMRLDGARVAHVRPLAVAGMPYGWLAGSGSAAPVYRLGDQAAVIPSFTGDGMAMALRSARHAADAILAERPAPAYHAELAAAFRRPVRLAGLVAALARPPAAQRLLAMAGCVAPGLLARIAAGTRIDGSAVRRRGAAGRAGSGRPGSASAPCAGQSAARPAPPPEIEEQPRGARRPVDLPDLAPVVIGEHAWRAVPGVKQEVQQRARGAAACRTRCRELQQLHDDGAARDPRTDGVGARQRLGTESSGRQVARGETAQSRRGQPHAVRASSA